MPGFGVILANQPGDQSWPMTAATWILIHKNPQDAAAAAEALKFFDWAYHSGGKMAEDLDYVAMPKNVVQQVEQYWSQTVQHDGKPVYAPDSKS